MKNAKKMKNTKKEEITWLRILVTWYKSKLLYIIFGVLLALNIIWLFLKNLFNFDFDLNYYHPLIKFAPWAFVGSTLIAFMASSICRNSKDKNHTLTEKTVFYNKFKSIFKDIEN